MNRDIHERRNTINRRHRDMMSRKENYYPYLYANLHSWSERDYNEPYSPIRDYRHERGRDYGMTKNYFRDYRESDNDYLTDDELMQWDKDIMREIPENDRQMFTKDYIERRSRELGIEFDKTYTFAEFYTTALMLYSDFYKVLGQGNIDVYLHLAKAFLTDDDIDLDGGEKLSAYYDYIVCAK